jgi:hypothetical protein
VVLSAAIVLAWQAAGAPPAELPAPPPPAPVAASSSPPSLRRPVWLPASLAVLHGGAMALFVTVKLRSRMCAGEECRSPLNTAGELVSLATAAALAAGTGLLGRHDGRRERKANLWGYRIAGALLCGTGAVLGGAGLSTQPQTDISIVELRIAGRALWTTGLPLLTYAFGYHRGATARMEVAPVMDQQRIGVVLSGRF